MLATCYSGSISCGPALPGWPQSSLSHPHPHLQVASATQAIGSGFRKLGNGITQTLSNKGRVNSSYDDAMPLGEDQVGGGLG